MLQKHIIFSLVLTISLFYNVVCAQNKVNARTSAKTPTVAINKSEKERPYTKWSLRVGGNISVIYLARNIKEKSKKKIWLIC